MPAPPPPPAAPRGELLFADEFEGPLDLGAWNVTMGPKGGSVRASGGFLVVEKGEGAQDASFAGTWSAFGGDVVVEARLWAPSLASRAYFGVGDDTAGAVAFFRGNGSSGFTWNTHRGAWENEELLAIVQPGEFYLARYARIADNVTFVLLDGDGARAIGRGAARAFTDGDLRVHFNLERGESEFLLVDFVRVYRAA